MYLTAAEYNALTGEAASQATDVRINIACKLLDARIGNYGTINGWKINHASNTWYLNNFTALTIEQKEAVKLWVCGMIGYLNLNNNMAQSSKNIKLGRFSVGSGNNVSSKILPDEMNFYDSILITSGIINRSINIK